MPAADERLKDRSWLAPPSQHWRFAFRRLLVSFLLLLWRGSHPADLQLSPSFISPMPSSSAHQWIRVWARWLFISFSKTFSSRHPDSYILFLELEEVLAIRASSTWLCNRWRNRVEMPILIPKVSERHLRLGVPNELPGGADAAQLRTRRG